MPIYLIIAPLLVSMLLVFWIYPTLLHIAIEKNIVDNPQARKLQKTPVPVLGGVAVFFGILITIGVMIPFADLNTLLPVVVSMVVLLYIGVMDDIIGLPSILRFVIEILIALLLAYSADLMVNNFYGLWGVYHIPTWLGLTLSILTCTGVINAINMIDGVNGLSSGFGIISCILFGIWFIIEGNIPMTVLAAVSVGALIPFFLHNVFGKKSKMFIGDGGALVLGLILSVFVISILNGESIGRVPDRIAQIPFVLAVLAIPVGDTLRVMICRIANGRSPSCPDQTHLHHILLSVGCSHILISTIELSLSLLVVLLWAVSILLGASADVQFIVVMAVALLATSGLPIFLSYHKKHDTKTYRIIHHYCENVFLSKTSVFFLKLRKFIDKEPGISDIESK